MFLLLFISISQHNSLDYWVLVCLEALQCLVFPIFTSESPLPTHLAVFPKIYFEPTAFKPEQPVERTCAVDLCALHCAKQSELNLYWINVWMDHRLLRTLTWNCLQNKVQTLLSDFQTFIVWLLQPYLSLVSSVIYHAQVQLPVFFLFLFLDRPVMTYSEVFVLCLYCPNLWY